MDETKAQAERMLRSAMTRSLRRALVETATRLRTAADKLTELEGEVDRIGLPPKAKGQRPVTADALLAEVLVILHSNAPDLGTLARTVEEFNREVSGPPSHAEDTRCRVTYGAGRCPDEHLPGAVVCFGHLWAAARVHGAGHVFPLGSPEPTEKVVPRGIALVGENGVHWTRQGDRWHAGGPGGDGGFYHWRSINGTEDGRELARLVPECVL